MKNTKEMLVSIGTSVGIVLLVLGAAGMDSENMVPPGLMLLVGLLLIFVTAKEEAKWEDDI